jgi:hypothetical protein
VVSVGVKTVERRDTEGFREEVWVLAQWLSGVVREIITHKHAVHSLDSAAGDICTGSRERG